MDAQLLTRCPPRCDERLLKALRLQQLLDTERSALKTVHFDDQLLDVPPLRIGNALQNVLLGPLDVPLHRSDWPACSTATHRNGCLGGR